MSTGIDDSGSVVLAYAVNMYACICRGITEAEVRQAGRAGLVSPDGLIRPLGLNDDACCGHCAERIQDFVAVALEGATYGGTQLQRLSTAPAD